MAAEPKADRARKRHREPAKWQAGSYDPGMEAFERRQPLRASEKPLRAAGSGQKEHAASQEALNRES